MRLWVTPSWHVGCQRRLDSRVDTGGTRSRFVVATRKLSEFLVSLGFVSRLLYWLKPRLAAAPLCASSAATRRRWVGRLLETVILTLIYLVRRDGGGWEHLSRGKARWFSITLKPGDAPYPSMGSAACNGLRLQRSCWRRWRRCISLVSWSQQHG